MALDLTQCSSSKNVSNSIPLVGEYYHFKLKQSMQDVSAELRKASPNLSPFIDVFYELMQAKVDPPLESIWVYTALTYKNRNMNISKGDSLDRLSAAKDLFQLVYACSASSGSSRSIALLAPVVFEVYEVVAELVNKDLHLKREKKAMKEGKSLIDVILRYICVCCCKVFDEERDSVNFNLIVPLTDLGCVWMDSYKGLESIFPLLSSDVCHWLSPRESDVRYLAGVVIVEAFLLKLSLNFCPGTPQNGFEKQLQCLAVGSISGFQNIYFFETLVRMMLKTSLPLSSLLKPDDEFLLRKVLYDAVILVDYSFLYLEGDLSPEHLRSLSMTRLIVTHEAIEYFRGLGDQSRAISYIKSYSASRLPSQIINWVTTQVPPEEKASRENGYSPKALIKWLRSLANQGIRVFDDDILKYQSRLDVDVSQAKQPAAKSDGKIVDDDLLFIVDKGEEDVRNELTSAEFVAAAQTMNSTETGGQKRKKGSSANKKKIKFMKYDLCQNSDSVKPRPSFITDDGSSGESEIENPISDEETEKM
ncbi:SNF2 domain protein [Quillaja saponaria]|uniref:SNF2 domain protein n=1 Tax=Quillaja saponaria TaxID=32244 RepID=A0AAD7Q2R5_QUISA|nr:SNF2 domain protein [Quillaja saponaria]